MDADFTTVVAWIVGIVIVVEFFHIGYLVNAIRKEEKKQTKLLLLQAVWWERMASRRLGSQVWLGESYEC